jgi:hypothetical protein
VLAALLEEVFHISTVDSDVVCNCVGDHSRSR